MCWKIWLGILHSLSFIELYIGSYTVRLMSFSSSVFGFASVFAKDNFSFNSFTLVLRIAWPVTYTRYKYNLVLVLSRSVLPTSKIRQLTAPSWLNFSTTNRVVRVHLPLEFPKIHFNYNPILLRKYLLSPQSSRNANKSQESVPKSRETEIQLNTT